MITGNKGEWSEVYALFKLLGDKQLSLGNKDLEQIQDFIFPILTILRNDSKGQIEYSIEDEIVIISENQEEFRVPIIEFKEKAESLLEIIKDNKQRTFAVPEIQAFMDTVRCFSLKASSSVKTDITIIIHDYKTQQNPTLGFSIKSQLGSPSTLLNAGKTTNFVFKIQNLSLTKEEIDEINAIDSRRKIMDRINEILKKEGIFKFVGTENRIFSNNLVLIDSRLPELLSFILYDFYSSKRSKVADLVAKADLTNPLDFDNSKEHRFYKYKIKRFLTDVALGMMPSKVWTGEYDATGGYLVIKDTGEILCYHIYNRNEFEDYLLNNTKLETASSSRHDFGKVYEEDGDLYFKLNLQIRFIK